MSKASRVKGAPRPASAPGRAPRGPRLKRLAINFFLVFNLLAITCWCFPLQSQLINRSRDFFRPYVLWAGLFQSWDMFSPVPKHANVYVEAIVLYQDGNTKNWAFPRVDQLSFIERYQKERYRKFVEHLEDDTSAAFWPDAARYIARLNNTRKTPVTMVLLVRYWSMIERRPDGAFASGPWDEHVFFSYRIKPGDLT